MEFLRTYLRQRRRVLGAFALFAGIFAISFALYRLPLRAVLYPAMLCALAGAILAGMDARRLWRRHAHLKRLQAASLLPEQLPEAQTLEESDYQALILQMCGERRAQEARMEERYAEMAGYYTLWAHQIKTPIAAMRLRLQEEDSALTRTLSAELTRIEQYVEMVLAYVRLDGRETDYVFREHDVDGIVRSCIRRFSGEFIARKLKLDYAPPCYRVVTDDKWLAFVIEQVLSNALKYTPSGSVSVSMDAPGKLCIRDTGIGIAPEDLPRIFQNGFTGLNGRVDRKASGLGLHLCKRVCDNLGHGLSIESRLGEGTQVTIDLSQRRREAE